MSHRSELEIYAEEMAKRRKTVLLIVKIVAALLAVALVATIALAIVDIVQDNPSSSSDKDDGDSVSLIKTVSGSKITVKQYSTIQYLSYVTVDEKYIANELVVDSSKVNIDVPGKYSVTYKLLDENGKTLDTLKITIIVEEYNEDMQELMTLVGKHAEKAGLTADTVKDMSKEDIVRKIYAYVRSPEKGKNDANIYFSDVSNVPNIDRNNWESDWVKEALLTLQMSRMKGDCYTYYSVSKAFFEYCDVTFGIKLENVGIKRAEGADFGGTHFWQMVNIGTEQAPKWYYYDATRSAGTFSSGTSCLVTLEELWSYKSGEVASGTAKDTYYYFNPEDYPTAETTSINN